MKTRGIKLDLSFSGSICIFSMPTLPICLFNHSSLFKQTAHKHTITMLVYPKTMTPVAMHYSLSFVFI